MQGNRIYMQNWLVFHWLVLLVCTGSFCLALPGLSLGQDDAGLPPISFNEKAVNDIEKRAGTDLEDAKQQARRLKASIEDELQPYQEFADKAADQARQYRELEKSAEDSAKANRDRAKKFAKEAKDPLQKNIKKLLGDSAAQYERDAKADKERAKEYRSKATELEQDSQELFDDMAIGAELLKRLEAVIAKEEEKPPADPEVSSLPDESGSGGMPEAPPLEFELVDVLGMWRYTQEDAGLFAIVQQHPDGETSNVRLEAHTDKRVWKGAMYARPTPEFPLIEFTYKPTADEMNKDIPQWARKKIEGQLEWKLAIDEAGDIVNPRLRVKFFPGEVKWNEEDGDQGSVRVIGEGLPRVFELEPVTNVSVRSMTQERIYLGLGGNHDPDLNPVQALVKKQPFWIRVSLPAEAAKEQGRSLTVTIKGLNGGGEETLELKGGNPAGQRPVVYSHPKAVYITACDVFGNTPRNPQTMSLQWISQKIFSEEGDCLDIDTDNEEIVEFRFGESYHRITMYDSWVQRGIKRHQQGFERLEIMLEGVLDSDKPQAVKDSAKKRLAMIENYRALARGGKLTDVHIFYVGEEYLGDVMGTGIIYMTDKVLEENYRYKSDPANRPLEQHSSTDPNFYNPVMKAYLEGLSGKDLSLDAHKKADGGIAWTSEAERYHITEAIRKTSGAYAARAIKDYAVNFTLGLYDGLVAATGADSYYLIVTGRDHMKNKRQPFWMRLNAAIGVASGAILNVAGSRAAQFFPKAPPRKTLGAVSTAHTLVTRTNSRAIAKGASLSDAIESPKSLLPQQRKQTYLELSDAPGGEGGPPCMSRVSRKATSRVIKNFEELSLDDLLEHWDIEDYLSEFYPKGTKILDPYSKKLYDVQVGPSCNAMSTNYAVFKGTGKRISQDEAHKVISNLMWEDVKAGKRKLDDLLSGPGIRHGYDQAAIRRYLRSKGARVAELPPLLNRNVKLRHVWALLEQGWNVKMVINLGKKAGQHEFHAVIIDGLVVTKNKTIKAVRVYDPNVGRLIEVPAAGFKNMIVKNPPNGYGVLTAFRWD